MLKSIRRHTPWILIAAGLALLVAGFLLRSFSVPLILAGGGLLGSVYLFILVRRLQARKSKYAEAVERGHHTPASDDDPIVNVSLATESPADEVESLVSQMLSNGRYALLLRPQIAQNLTAALYNKASGTLEQTMGLVPAGEVHLEPSVFDVDFPLFAADDSASPMGLVIAVEGVFLDRYPVTNQQFLQFVSGGGYQEVAIWDAEIWPAVLDFTDSTGQPGPRFWANGRFSPGEAKLPVVGISWYEAVAYARWVGKRLPTDAEWVKAASWPVTLSPGTHVQRKYPWGEAMDRRKANVWGSGPARVVPVDEFSDGVSVGGLYQLIGNVWEWTATNLEIDSTVQDDIQQKASAAALFKSIRGGAFDTYFENQANCQFASGEHPILRKHNIGFRCALSLCDIAPPPRPESDRGAADSADGNFAGNSGSLLEDESHLPADELAMAASNNWDQTSHSRTEESCA